MHAGLDIEMPAAKFYGEDCARLVERARCRWRRSTRASADRAHEAPYLTRPDPQAYPGPGRVAAHVALAREVAEKAWSCSRTTTRCSRSTGRGSSALAVVGHLADADNTGDHGSSQLRPPHFTSALRGCATTWAQARRCSHSDGEDPAEVGRVARDVGRGRGRRRTRWDEVGEYVSDDRGMTPSGPAEKRPLRVQLPLLHPIEISGGDSCRSSLKPRDVDASGRPARRTRAASSSWSAAASTRWRNGGTPSRRS